MALGCRGPAEGGSATGCVLGFLRLRGGRLVELAARIAHLHLTLIVGVRRGVAETIDRSSVARESLRCDGGNSGSSLSSSGHFNLEVEQKADGFFADLPHHALIQSETLALVLDQRIALCHRSQADAIFEIVHLVEVVAPAAIDYRKHYATLELAHGGLSECGRAGLILHPGI